MELDDLFQLFFTFDVNLANIMGQNISQRPVKIEDVLSAIRLTIKQYEED